MYWNKQYLMKKLWYSAFWVWGCEIIKRAPCLLFVNKLFLLQADLLMLFAARGHDDLLIMLRPQTFRLQKARSFFWAIVCFCTTNGSFRILKKAGGSFSKSNYFRNFLKVSKFTKKESFSLFQYSKRIIARRETNDTWETSYNTLLFGAWKF